METALTLAILAALLLVVWSGVGAGSRSLNSIGRRIRSDLELVRIDRAIRGSLERILVPFWRSCPRFERLEGGIRLYDLDGIPDRYLEIRYSDGLLAIEDGERQKAFGGIAALDVGFVDPGFLDRRSGKGSDGTGCGSLLRLCLRLTSGEQVDFVARTGSSPLGRGDEEPGP